VYHTNWNYAKEVKLGAPTTITNENYLLILKEPDINYNDFRLDGYDLRVWNLSGSIPYEFFVEEWNRLGETYVWVKIPDVGTSSIRIEYGYSGAANESLTWDGYLCSTIYDFTAPSGWSLETSYNGYYLRGAATAGGTGGGPESHNHTPGSLSLGYVSDYQLRVGSGSHIDYKGLSTHTHYIETNFQNANLNHPTYKLPLVSIQGKIPMRLPPNLMAFFRETFPSGWIGWSQMALIAIDNSISGLSGGHSHVHTAGTSYEDTHYSGGDYAATLGVGTHKHSVSMASSKPLPSYKTFLPGRSTTTVNFNKATKITFMFKAGTGAAIPPLGWEEDTQMRGRFVYFHSTPNLLGGSDTHTHTVTLSAVAQEVCYSDDTMGATLFRMGAGAHGVSGTTGAASSVPLYKEIVFGQRKTSKDQLGIYNLTPQPEANFSATPRVVNGPTATISFTDGSSGTPTSWDWDWGDLTTHGTTPNPTHQYTDYGYYTVKLRVANAAGNSTITKSSYIHIAQNPPIIHIAVDPETGNPPLTVSCSVTDFSYGPITSYDWDWGDNTTHGSGSTPTHQYMLPGVFPVTCIATNAFGTGADSRVVMVPEGIGKAVVVVINKVDISRATRKVDINLTLGNTIASGQLTLGKRQADDLTTLTEGDPVEVYRYFYTQAPTESILGQLALGSGGLSTSTQLDFTTQHVFSGTIKFIETSRGTYKVSIEDHLAKLTKFNLNTAWGVAQVDDILADIVDQAGLLSAIESTSVELHGFKCKNRQAYEACQSICNAMQWQMYYDPRDAHVHIGIREPSLTTVYLVTNVNLAGTPKWNKDMTTLYNQVTVTGRTVEASVGEAFELPANGNNSRTLTHKVKSITVKFNSGTALWTQTASTAPDETATGDYYISETLDEDTQEITSILYIYHIWDGATHRTPAAGDDIELSYVYELAAEAVAEDLQSQQTYGLRATAYTRTDLTALADIQSAADAFIAYHKDPIDQVDVKVFPILVQFWLGDRAKIVDLVRPLTMDGLTIIRWKFAWPNPVDDIQIGKLQPFTADYLKGLENRLRSLEQS